MLLPRWGRPGWRRVRHRLAVLDLLFFNLLYEIFPCVLLQVVLCLLFDCCPLSLHHSSVRILELVLTISLLSL